MNIPNKFTFKVSDAKIMPPIIYTAKLVNAGNTFEVEWFHQGRKSKSLIGYYDMIRRLIDKRWVILEPLVKKTTKSSNLFDIDDL